MNEKANTTTPRVLLVGLPKGLPDTDHDDFYTDKHFLDYDIVIFDVQGALHGSKHNYIPEMLNDVLSLRPEVGSRFFKRYTDITHKLLRYINKGGFAIAFLRALPILKYQEQDRDQTLRTIPLNKFLPWGKEGIRKEHGSNIEFSTEGPIGEFWQATKGFWNYQAIYNSPPANQGLAHVKGHPDEVVAALTATEERGFLITTPVPSFFKDSSDNKASVEVQTSFVRAVASLYKALRTEGPAPQLPQWAAEYSLPGEIDLREEISATDGQIRALQKQSKERSRRLDALCLHKLLVTGHDSALEQAVDRVLTDLGFEVEPGPKKRVDRIATYGGRKLAIEVQGVKKGAKEDHARSLTIWVQEVASQDGKEPKGLLVINAFRETPLADRTGGNPWPGETIPLCERQGHCAMTGLQLLGLYLDAKNDDTKREQLIDSMFDTEGLFAGYEDWTRFLPPVEVQTTDKANIEN